MNEELTCRSCPREFPMPATHIAHPRLKDGGVGPDWPLCRGHVDFAMVAGWFPIDEIRTEDTPNPPCSLGEP